MSTCLEHYSNQNGSFSNSVGLFTSLRVGETYFEDREEKFLAEEEAEAM